MNSQQVATTMSEDYAEDLRIVRLRVLTADARVLYSESTRADIAALIAAYDERCLKIASIEELAARPAPWVCEFCGHPYPKDSGNPDKWASCDICNGEDFEPNPALTPRPEDEPA